MLATSAATEAVRTIPRDGLDVMQGRSMRDGSVLRASGSVGIWQRCGRSLGLSLSPSPRKHSALAKAVNTAKSFSALYTKLRFNDVWM